VPEDAEVDVGVVGILGGVDNGGEGPGVPGGPRIRIVGAAVMGGIEVKRAKPERPGRAELSSG
jgi:hypothetical protein